MATKEPSAKALTYLYDPDETYTYNAQHGTEYPYNKFPTGLHGRKYKPTRFIEWEPIPEDIIIRHAGSQIFVNFSALFPEDVIDPTIEVFQLRAKRLNLQNFICEQINFFTALYDDDNDLITSMLVAKYITDSETYTIETFEEYYKEIYDVLFPPKTMAKIQKMVEENDVGDDTVGLFPLDFLRDMFIISFMIKVMHIFIEHFIMRTGNSPKDLYELFAKAFTYAMNKINPNMYILLYNYVSKNVIQSISSNTNIYDMQAIEGVTAPTTTQFVMRKILLCDGLIKLTFASDWDKINKRPTFSCVGLIKTVTNQASFLTRKKQLRYTLVGVDDVSQLMSDSINSSLPVSMIRSFNPGEYMCIETDLQNIIAHITLKVDVTPVDYYLTHLPQMNNFAETLVNSVLYNEFHSSLTTNVLNMRQKYIVLMYVRKRIMDIYGITEADSKTNPMINILTGKAMSTTTRSLTQKDINNIKKYAKLNNLKEHLLDENNVTTYIENIMQCVLSSYSVVNHNDESLLGTPIIYESGSMTQALLEMVVMLFDSMNPSSGR